MPTRRGSNASLLPRIRKKVDPIEDDYDESTFEEIDLCDDSITPYSNQFVSVKKGAFRRLADRINS
ncbi:hypothetical protein PRIPAC_95939, partial [Pristionchus pacificus]|uniref:Uncharacterized protein n=1 Tax=Pristionchus pacificus TaxID=54126 RepID=A0A2A6CUK7_PRIPA